LTDLTLALDRSKILTTGRKAVEDYLQKLHIYKSTADFDAGSKLYADMTGVDPDFWGTKVRDEVLRNKQPRKVFVQVNTVLDEKTGKVELKEYDASLEGMIKSYAERGI
jgi:dipeptidyl-peptidase III